MITRLDANRHLKRFTSMTLVEQQAYLSEVRTWNERSAALLLRRTGEQPSRFVTAIQCSVGWSDAECRAWEDGVRLMSAFSATDAMFGAAYTDSAKETIRWMVKELRSIDNGQLTIDNGGAVPASPIKSISPTEPIQPIEKRKRGRPRKQELPSITGDWGQKGVAGCYSDPTKGSKSLTCDGGKVGGGSPVRPKHIDQYVHLLPRKTQERAALVKDLLQQMDVARENARLLMNDQKSLPADRARWASLATKCDNEVRSIYKELDEEWEKLVKSGRVVVDDLGNARALPIDNGKLKIENGETPESYPQVTPQVTPQEKAGDPRETPDEKQETPKDANRRRLLRKWLVDTRRGNGDTRTEHVRKWEETFAEYLAIEGEAAFEDDKIKAAAKHYEIDMTACRNNEITK